MCSGTPNIRTLPVTAPGSTTATRPAPTSVTLPPRLPLPQVGERVELDRYQISSGERILYGQRIDGVVRFLPEEPVVLDPSSGPSEGSRCCPREPIREEPRPAGRQRRGDDDRGKVGAGTGGAVAPAFVWNWRGIR